METIIQATISSSHARRLERPLTISKFMNWCNGQEKNHLGWLDGILTIHGCVFTPITLFAIILSGTYFPFFIGALVAMSLAACNQLAAMPTKVTIPVFFFSVLIDVAIIISCISIGFNPAATQI